MKSRTIITDLDREFARLKGLAMKALHQIDDEQFFQTIDSESNSIAIIVKHLSGNMKSRWRDFLISDGEKPDRQRDQEFIILEGENRHSIMQHFEEGWAILFDATIALQDNDLQKTVFIRGEPLTVFQALVRQLTHYGYHIGQIILLAKHFQEEQWQTLSIAKNPKPYKKKHDTGRKDHGKTNRLRRT